MLSWSVKKMRLPLAFTWKIARGTDTEKTNFIVTVTDSDQKGSGEVAWLTGVDFDHNKYQNLLLNAQPQTREELFSIQLPSCWQMASDAALTMLEGQPPEILSVPTSFTLPVSKPEEIESFIDKYNLQNFPSLKIKIKSFADHSSVIELKNHFDGPIRIDANECFSTASETLKFCEKISDLNIQFLEQPLGRHNWNEQIELKKRCPFPLLADEFITNSDIPENTYQGFAAINIKLMKSGSFTQAKRQIEQARSQGLEVLLGCMVETTLGIYHALCLAPLCDHYDLDGFLFFKEEPFGLVTEKNGILGAP